MRVLIGAVLAAGLLSGCMSGPPEILNVNQADIARCEYEAGFAPQTYERTLGDSIVNALRQNRQRTLCLRAKSAENDVSRPPQVSAPVTSVSSPYLASYVIGSCDDPWSGLTCPKSPRPALRRPSQPAPAYCTDSTITNPYLRANCR